MADDRLACLRSPSIAPIIAERLIPRSSAISFKQSQNSSSMLTLVLWPAMTIERFETGDTASPPRMSQRYYMERMAIRTRKTPGLSATGTYRSVAVAVWASGFSPSRTSRTDPALAPCSVLSIEGCHGCASDRENEQVWPCAIRLRLQQC